jgi:hypothetical protein
MCHHLTAQRLSYNELRLRKLTAQCQTLFILLIQLINSRFIRGISLRGEICGDIVAYVSGPFVSLSHAFVSLSLQRITVKERGKI